MTAWHTCGAAQLVLLDLVLAGLAHVRILLMLLEALDHIALACNTTQGM